MERAERRGHTNPVDETAHDVSRPSVAVVICAWQCQEQLSHSVGQLLSTEWVVQVLIVDAPDAFAEHRLTALSKLAASLCAEAIGVIVFAGPAVFAPAYSLPAAGEVSAIFDHDLVRNGQRSMPFFKPGVCRELFSNMEYCSAVYLTRSDVAQNANQDCSNFDVGTFLGDAASVIHHPVVACSFLEAPVGSSQKETCAATTDGAIKVSILIPTRDRLELLRPCVDTLLRDNADQIDLIVMDNGSTDEETLAWLQSQQQVGTLRVLRCDYPFNWSRLNNDGAKMATGEVLILLNNDTVSIEQDWIRRLSIAAMEDNVGCVGPMLLYPDGSIQHAGIVVGYGGYADHVYVGERPEVRSVFVAPTLTRQVAAVTGACLVIKKQLFEQFGGMNEQLEVAGDLELCLRLHGEGYRNLYKADTRLIHKESKTRKRGLPEADRQIVANVIKQTMPQGDPFFNPNLSLHSLFPMPRIDPVPRS